MVSSQSLLYFSGVTKSHLLHHLALITDSVFTSNYKARSPAKMKTQALFQWENTIVTLCNYIWVSYGATYKVIAREDRNGWLGYCLPPHLTSPSFSAHTSSTVPVSLPPLPVWYFSAALPWHTSGTPVLQQDSHMTHLDSHLFLGYWWMVHKLFPKHMVHPRQILPHFCGKGPEQPLQDPMGSCHAGHRSFSPPTCQHFPILYHCKSSLSLKSCREPHTSLHKLRAGKRPKQNQKTWIKFRKKKICWWSSLVNSL